MGQFSREEFLKTELGKDYLKAWETVGKEIMQERLSKVNEGSKRKTFRERITVFLNKFWNYIKGRF